MPAGEGYAPIHEHGFRSTASHPLATFAIDVDTASYANVRRFLRDGMLPPPDAVRIEELINYFPYGDPPPDGNRPFAATMQLARAPWRPEHYLLRVGLKAREVDRQQRPPSNLVFLIDTSGSMAQHDKLPLVKRALSALVEQLGPGDRIAIVVYAGAAGLVLPSTPGSDKKRIFAALDRLEAGGSTNGAGGIELAYRVAAEGFLRGGSNRVILATDGDFNVGPSSEAALVALIQDKARTGVFLSVLGVGTGNLQDAKMEQLADRGNGHYAYLDDDAEARKVLVDEMSGTLLTVAKDVKIQIDFNPAQIGSYRQIGYENRALAARDFDDDEKDAGEMGAGHTVTALFELIPADVSPAGASAELLTLRIRYKEPSAAESELLELPLGPEAKDARIDDASPDLAFAAAVAEFGMILRGSEHRGASSYESVLALARRGGPDPGGHRAEFVDLVVKASVLDSRSPR